MVGVKAPIECWPIAVERVRYVGEPVAVVVASDRYRAEDALDLIEVAYRPLPAVVDPLAATAAGAPILHPAVQSNVSASARFATAIRTRAFAAAAHRVRVDVHYPRNSCTPIETYGVIAEYDPGEDCVRCTGQFPGTVFTASGDGACAEGAGQSPSPAHAAGFRRQLRRQAGRVFLHRADFGRGARRRPAGEMDRGPARTPGRFGFGNQPGYHAGSGGRC